jgi:hypothetical protein
MRYETVSMLESAHVIHCLAKGMDTAKKIKLGIHTAPYVSRGS